MRRFVLMAINETTGAMKSMGRAESPDAGLKLLAAQFEPEDKWPSGWVAYLLKLAGVGCFGPWEWLRLSEGGDDRWEPCDFDPFDVFPLPEATEVITRTVPVKGEDYGEERAQLSPRAPTIQELLGATFAPLTKDDFAYLQGASPGAIKAEIGPHLVVVSPEPRGEVFLEAISTNGEGEPVNFSCKMGPWTREN